jgi:hypothetical protein
MPVHDWTRVEPGIFHDFHHAWIEQLKRALNEGILPADYYALAEQHAGGFGPDILTLQGPASGDHEDVRGSPARNGAAGLQLVPPKVRITAETDMEFYRRKQSTVAIRHVGGDRLVAVVDVVSPGNKAGRSFRAFVEKAASLIDRQIHLLILDLQPPGARDPDGIHGAIWGEITDVPYHAPSDKGLTLASCESAETVRAYVEPVAIGDVLPAMPLYLEPGAYVNVPLEATYEAAFLGVPRRWRSVLERVPS